jgi:O-methyltransferase domain
MPDYFDKYGPREPVAEAPVPIGFAMDQPDKTFWQILNQDPKTLETFTMSMTTIEQHHPITGMYNFAWVEEKAKESDRIVFVDVGGGKGQAIKVLRGDYPGLPLDRCVLQDRPEIIEAVKSVEDENLKGVKLVAIDFHKEQPIKGRMKSEILTRLDAKEFAGALTYWIRRCLHDYSDEICTNMLKIVAESMAEDSRLLLVEQIQPNPPSPIAAYLDIVMLNLGGKERTIECFETITAAAGLKISGVYHSSTSPFAVVECVKAVS